MRFIRENMRVAPARLVPEISLYAAHPGSGLRRLSESGSDAPPYWAYQWAGGTVLARHFLDRPESRRGRRVLDLGAGSGIVAIAAALAGASRVVAAEIDGHGRAALVLNAALNNARIEIVDRDILDEDPPFVDIVAVGDLFYEPSLAARVTDFLGRCRTSGADVLIGDPGRAFLPRDRLRLLADYVVPDFGSAGGKPAGRSSVFAFDADNRSAKEQERDAEPPCRRS